MTDRQGQRRIRNLLLDRGFQLRTTGAFVLVCLVLTSLFAGLFYHQLREASRVESTGIEEFDVALREHLKSEDQRILWQMVAGIVLLTLLLTGASILRTHHIVGPLYVLSRAMRELGQGQCPSLRALRRGDEFGRLIDDFSAMVRDLRERNQRMAERIEALARMDERGEPAREALLAIAAELRPADEEHEGGGPA